MTQLPDKVEAGQELEVQIAPFGTFECHDGVPEHKGVEQIVDEQTVDAMIAARDGEILVDIDHRSLEGDTEAAAWITDLWKDDSKGLMARFKFTSKGAEAVSGRAYRYVSPTWFMGSDGRPTKLDSVALTNCPNLPVAPLLNSRIVDTAFKNAASRFKNAPTDADLKTDGENADAPEGRFRASRETPSEPASETTSETNNTKGVHMDELKALLGLAAEATEAEIVDAVKALKAKNDELEGAAKDAAAEQFATENADKGIEKDVLKNAYLAAPEVARNMVACLKPVAKPLPAEPVCIGKNAKTPELKTVVKNSDATTPLKERIANARKRPAKAE